MNNIIYIKYPNVTEYKYDDNGNIIYMKDYIGNEWHYEYDDDGQKLKYKYTDSGYIMYYK